MLVLTIEWSYYVHGTNAIIDVTKFCWNLSTYFNSAWIGHFTFRVPSISASTASRVFLAQYLSKWTIFRNSVEKKNNRDFSFMLYHSPSPPQRKHEACSIITVSVNVHLSFGNNISNLNLFSRNLLIIMPLSGSPLPFWYCPANNDNTVDTQTWQVGVVMDIR